MIVTIGQTKGGVGKTVVAVNLAIDRCRSGRDVLLIDADTQASASDFSALRSQAADRPGFTTVQLLGAAVRTECLNLRHRFDDIIIDSGGRDSGGLRAALTVCDVVAVPFQPRTVDVWTLEKMADLIAEARSINPTLRSFSFINCADAVGSSNFDAATVLQESHEIPFSGITVGRRKAFERAFMSGLSVSELKPGDVKASAEMAALLAESFSIDDVLSGPQTAE